MKETLEISRDDAQGLAYGDYDDKIYKIISNEIVDTSRWAYRNKLIVQTISDGRFWESFYRRGATESQDESPYEYGDVKFEEVFPKQVEITIYE